MPVSVDRQELLIAMWKSKQVLKGNPTEMQKIVIRDVLNRAMEELRP